MNLLLYGIVALAILGTLGGIGYKIREAGYDSCKVEWNEANVAAQQKLDADRKRQEAIRTKEAEDAARRLSEAQKRARSLMVSLEAHIKASGTAAQCPIPPSLHDDWNRANAGPEGERTGAVHGAGRPATTAR